MDYIEYLEYGDEEELDWWSADEDDEDPYGDEWETLPTNIPTIADIIDS
jgi:hypothetical protein